MLTELHPIFQDCCDADSFRFSIESPFILSGFVWATDARIMVRRTAADLSPELTAKFGAGGRKLPSVETIWSNATEGARSIIGLPDVPWQQTCPTCEGIERTECEDCHGLRTELLEDPIPVGPRFLAPYYFGILRRHGVLLVGINDIPNAAITFSLEDIECCVMPMDLEAARKKLQKSSQEMTT
jgi:hypothetical protein